MTFLSFEAQGRDRARIKPLQADRLPCLLAIAIGSIVETHECRINFIDELALTVASTEVKGAPRLRTRPIRNIGMLRRFLVQLLQCLFCRAQDLCSPSEELSTEARWRSHMKGSFAQGR